MIRNKRNCPGILRRRTYKLDKCWILVHAKARVSPKTVLWQQSMCSLQVVNTKPSLSAVKRPSRVSTQGMDFTSLKLQEAHESTIESLARPVTCRNGNVSLIPPWKLRQPWLVPTPTPSSVNAPAFSAGRSWQTSIFMRAGIECEGMTLSVVTSCASSSSSSSALPLRSGLHLVWYC